MTEEQNMEKDEIKSSESQQLNNREVFKKIIKYVQENASAFTFLTTSAVVVGGAVLRFILYLIEYGKTIYYNISSSLIDVSGDNMLYDLFVKGVFALLIIIINLILFLLWRGESKMRIKVGCSLLFVLFPDLILIFCLAIDNFHGIKYSISAKCLFFLMGFFLGVVLFFYGMYNGICEYRSKLKLEKEPKKEIKNEVTKKSKSKTKNESEKKTKKERNSLNVFIRSCIVLALLIVIESFLFIYFGYNVAEKQKQFKVINGDDNTYYVVVYENPDKYIIAPCETEDNFFSFTELDIKQEIDRDGIEYKLMQKKEQTQ
ncbi:MAG: hypothetical protein HDT46_10290 [Ruminococcaceae bacterium]|nr:hypothetical protein [Oscillospiraceae bacterium]